MQIGCSAPTSGPLIEPDSLLRIATEAESLGFDYVTVSDHVMIPTSIASRYPYSDSGEFPSGAAAAARLEQLTAATFIAAATTKLRIVTSVMVVPHRPAVLTAKILATIDFLSKGRLTLGIGAGWCEEEFVAIGALPFAERGAVTDEFMAVCRELWTADEPKFDGKYVKFKDVLFPPKPPQGIDPDLGRRRKRAGDAADRSLWRRLVSDRHQSAIPDGHADPLQGRRREIARPDREGRPRSESRRPGLPRVLQPRSAAEGHGRRPAQTVHRRCGRLRQATSRRCRMSASPSFDFGLFGADAEAIRRQSPPLPRRRHGKGPLIMQLGMTVGMSGPHPKLDMEMILEAERLGFSQVWTGEAYSTDAVSPAAWILARTTKIKAGTGIMQMPARTPACAAMTVLSLQALSGNRFLCGIGPSGPSGDRGLARRAVRQADAADQGIHRHHQADSGARETAGVPRRAVFHPL